MIKRINIGGIERQLSVSNMADGSLYGMVGARHLDGNIRPAQGLEELSDVSLAEGERLVYVHKYGDYCHYIVETKDGGVVYIDNGNREKISDYVGGVKSVSSIGNMLIVTGCDIPDIPNISGVRTWVWKNDKYAEWKVGGMPTIIFKREPYSYGGESEHLSIQNKFAMPAVSFPTDGYAVQGVDGTNSIDAQRELAELYKAGQGQLREDAYHGNSFIDSILIRYGLRMYDGSYAYVSPPILLPSEKNAYTMKGIAKVNDTYSVKSAESYVVANGYSVGYRLAVDSVLKGLDTKLTPYIDIFVSEPIDETSTVSYIERIKTASNAGGSGYNYQEDLFLTFDVPQKSIDIEGSYVYYRVDSIKIEEVSKEKEYVDAVLQVGEKMNYLRQLPILENVRGMSHYDGVCSYVYNGRLHLGGVTEYLTHSISRNLYSYAEANDIGIGYSTDSESVAVVYYDIDGSERYVSRTISNALSGSELSSLISVPDGRAKRLVLAVAMSNRWIKMDVPLQTHAMDNLSYYYKRGNYIPWKEITKEEYDAIKGLPYNGTIKRDSVIKVSELHNPMVFDNAKTYTVGSGSVVAMVSATKAMSQGQFGQYPLYVFTSEGIYAMLSGGGDVLYSNVAPVNHHVVENPRTVCSLDDAVVFGTRQGLFVMSGGDSVKISTSLDDHGIVRNGRGIETVVATQVFGATLTEMTTMRRLIAEGMVSYDYINEEVLLYKPDNLLCYAYSLRSKMWQSYKRSVDYAVNSYPELLLVDGQKVLRTSDEDSLKVEPEFLLVTNAMQLSDAMSSKRIERIHLLSHFAGNGEDSRLLLAVAGSNDGEEYALTYRREYKVRELHNVTLPHSASAFRYVSLIVYGKNLDKRSYLNGIVVEYDDKRQER